MKIKLTKTTLAELRAVVDMLDDPTDQSADATELYVWITDNCNSSPIDVDDTRLRQLANIMDEWDDMEWFQAERACKRDRDTIHLRLGDYEVFVPGKSFVWAAPATPDLRRNGIKYAWADTLGGGVKIN